MTIIVLSLISGLLRILRDLTGLLNQHFTHVQKREWENTDRLLCKHVTQSNLIYDAARLLGVPFIKNPKELFC